MIDADISFVLIFRLSRFVRHLPPAISKDKQFCQDLHSAYVKQTIEAIKDNFDKVEEASKLESKLKNLDSIAEDEANKAAEGCVAWRPSNNALDNQAAHDLQTIQEAKIRIEKELKALQDEVAGLEKNVSEFSDDIAANSQKINKILQH